MANKYYQAVTGLMAGVVLASAAWGAESFVVKDIQIRGLERVEPGTLLSTLPIRVGDVYSDALSGSIIKSLFDLGLFYDVQVETVGEVLVLNVTERPSIGKVDFMGFKEFDKDRLTAVMKEIGLSEGRSFDKAALDRAEKDIRQIYLDRGFYDVDLKVTTTPVDKNRINIGFTMNEGDVAKIRTLDFQGNTAFSDGTLRSQMALQSSGLMSWYTKSDRYSQSKLQADLQSIRSFYTQRGYLDFKVESSKVVLSEDKRSIDIEIVVSEGPRYTVGSVDIVGDYLGREDVFKKLIAIKSGSIYNSEKVAETVNLFTQEFGNLGYAFANVEVFSKTDKQNGQVGLRFSVQPGSRAYIRNVNISGNRRTRDEVIRRELRQLESSWYSAEKIKLSRDRLNRLGYFSDVNITLQEVQGQPDMADLLVTVKESSTGSLSLTAGYSSDDKLSLGGGIKQDNIFGSGQYLAFDVNTSNKNRTFSLSSVNPYFTQNGISRSLDVAYRTTSPTTQQGGDYKLITKRAGLTFGIPYSETDRVFFGAAAENVTIKKGSSALPASYQTYYDDFGASSNSFPLSISWVKDQRDSAIIPTDGGYSRLAFEVSPAGDARYWRLDANHQQYFPVNKQITFAVNVDAGVGKGMSGRPFPVFKNYYVGGIGSVRGFESGTAGPVDAAGNYVGGTRKLVLNTELILPFPGTGSDKSLRTFIFADAGAAFRESEKIAGGTIRASVGVGLTWLSPIGPLKFSYAKPVKQLASDKVQKFQFQIGTSF